MNGRSVLFVALEEVDSAIVQQLRDAGWAIQVAKGLHAAARTLKMQPFQVALLLPGDIASAAECAEIDRFLRAHREPEWVGAFRPRALEHPGCRDLIIDHLFDHHTVPLDLQRLGYTLGHALGRARIRGSNGEVRGEAGSSPIVGDSEALLELLSQLRRVAKADAPVLITGESGSGKELAAKEIHRYSRRAAGPFVPVNCGAIQASLIQSELFGHARGAFTGADRDKAGLFEAAAGGTLFLDEIGDLPMPLQINLLRFLQEKTINRVGSTRILTLDLRVVAATNVNLEEAVAAGTFREDLYYRLNVLPIRVPSLRERKADILALAEHFFGVFADEKNPRVRGFSHAAAAAMEAHDWPGNVRELINRVRRAMVMAEGRLIVPADLALAAPEAPRAGLDDAREEAERQAVSSMLLQAGSNVTEAARRLGVSRMTLYRLIAKHGIEH